MGADSNGVPLQGNGHDESVVVYFRSNEIPGVESDKDARLPIQETPAAEHASLSEMENMKDRPKQESGIPRKSTGNINPPVAGNESLPSDKDARRPTQETPEAQKSPESVEFKNMKERPVQESKNATSDSSGKEARRPTQESPEAEKLSPGVETEDQSPEHIVQKTQGLSKLKEEGEDLRPLEDDECSDEKPLETSTRRETESKGSPEEALPTQETMTAGKGPFEETGLEVGVKGHPTD